MRILLSALLVGLAASVSAQTLSTVHTFPSRQYEGVLRTPTFTIPADVPDGELLVTALLNTADYENLAHRICADVYMIDVTQPTGRRLMSTNRSNNPLVSCWRGGPFFEDGLTNPPPVLFSLGVQAGTRGRDYYVELEVIPRMRVSFVVQRLEF